MPNSATTFVNSRDQYRSSYSANGGSQMLHRGSPKPQTAGNGIKTIGGHHQQQNRQELGAAMKMPVPPTELFKKEAGTTANSNVQRAGNQQRRPWRIDDTESLPSTTTGNFSQFDQENAHGQGYARPQQDPAPLHSLNQALGVQLGPNWQEEADEGRKIMGVGPQEYYQQQNDEQEEFSDEETDQEFDQQHEGEEYAQQVAPPIEPTVPNVPSKIQQPAFSKTVAAAKPQDLNTKQEPLPPQRQPLSGMKLTKTTKSSSMVTSSEEEAVLPAKLDTNTVPTKRPRSEDLLDYDLPTLKAMNYSDLEAELFTHDPRLPLPMPVHDAHGVPLDLAGRLKNMPRMQEADIRSMFESQTDEEREQTGDWFMSSLHDMMKQLVRVRVDRRKISIKFEMEVKRRLMEVEKTQEVLQRELSEMKSGGNELVRGRTPSMVPKTPFR